MSKKNLEALQKQFNLLAKRSQARAKVEYADAEAEEKLTGELVELTTVMIDLADTLDEYGEGE